ncbi:MAG: PKD domain-containing protein, partial [Flavisolibacter sp.]|nr:PKD domain-containing protein [Flavisolibacter sp.]
NENSPPFDPARPINASRNNTGLQQLPPVSPAFIWYPYAASPDFPDVGTGGRNAMAGPVYYVDDFPKNSRYPDYFNGKLFIYDWIRRWIKIVRMLPNGDFDKMDDFMTDAKFNAPIDMEVGPDGRIYGLEYGSGWFAKNPDAGLFRIDYISGNRPPKVDSLKVAKESGGLPFSLDATVQAKDPEGDALVYNWKVGDTTIQTKEPRLHYTINKAGEYNVTVEVADDNKASNKSDAVTVYAGNTQPELDIQIQGNQTFYFPGKPVQYKVLVRDEGDTISKSNLYISTEYVQNEREAQTLGHQVVTGAMIGKNIMLNSDCKGCHKVDEKSIGPSFTQVAQKYLNKAEVQGYLTDKILHGSKGVWGETAMPAHPGMKEGDAQQIVQWILTLAQTGPVKKSLPDSGKITPKATDPKKAVLAINATYTDAGGRGVSPLSASEVVYLRSNVRPVGSGQAPSGFSVKDSANTRYLILPANEGVIPLRNIDFTGIRSIEFTGFGSGMAAQYQIEVLIGDKNGQKIGEGQMNFSAGRGKITTLIPLQGAPAGQVQKEVAILIRRLSGDAVSRPLLQAIRFVPK